MTKRRKDPGTKSRRVFGRWFCGAESVSNIRKRKHFAQSAIKLAMTSSKLNGSVAGKFKRRNDTRRGKEEKTNLGYP